MTKGKNVNLLLTTHRCHNSPKWGDFNGSSCWRIIRFCSLNNNFWWSRSISPIDCCVSYSWFRSQDKSTKK